MPKSELRTGNVLLIDVIRYSPRTDDQQSQIVGILNRLVRETPAMVNTPEEDRLCLPTGDGLAAVFFRDPRSPVHCALELDERLKAHNSQAPEEQRFRLRMGINQGLVYVIKDINQRENLAGDGMNRVQRVMDCGDEGHILVSQEFADSLARADSVLAQFFHPLGEFEVKHGEKITIANIYDGKHGNPEMPSLKPRVGGTKYETAPALRIMLAVSRPLVGYFHESAEKSRLVNPSSGLSDVFAQPLSPLESCIETEDLRKALQKAGAPVEISVLHGATPRDMIERLTEGRFRVLHFDGYGNTDGSLIFESLHGEAHLVSPGLLARMVTERGIRLVVLRVPNASQCVEALRDAGVPAVVGMIDTIQNDAAVLFISRFYRELSRGRPLKEAFEQGCLTVNFLFSTSSTGEDALLLYAEDEVAPVVELPYRESPPIFNSYSTKPATVPESETPFMGREVYMVSLIKKLTDGGVVELRGQEGVGKTALARAVAQWYIDRGRFPGGVFWIDLKYGGSRESVWDAIGNEVAGDGFSRLMPEEKESFLEEHFREKPSLIILDSFSMVVKDTELRRWASGGVRPPSALMATTALDADIGEIEILRELTPSEARMLFIEHARHRGWNSLMNKGDREVIDEICQLVGYLPLPIVLMASRAALTPFDELKSAIQRSMEAGSNPGNVFLPECYRITDACLNVSYELTGSEEARQIFRRLAVLDSSASDELIRTICGISNWTSAVAELIRASLLRKEGDRYQFHPLVRQYAMARLKASGEEDTYRGRVEKAQRYYLQSLEIKEELGNKSKIATSLTYLALIYERRGDLHTAVRLLAVAYDIFAAIGSANATRVKQNLEKLREAVGEEYFEDLLMKARSAPDAVVREALSKGLFLVERNAERLMELLQNRSPGS